MTKKKDISTLTLLIIYIILSILLFDPKLFTGGDNAVYVILAKSIISGKGYRNIERPEEPLHTQYPPGFPLLLSIFILVFGENIIILKFFILLIGSGALFFMTKIIQIIFKDHAKIVVLFYLSIPIFIIYNHWLLSEIPFLFFSLGALYFSLKNSAKNNSLYFIISSIFATYAFFIRTAGIALIFAFIVYTFLKKRYLNLVIFLIIFLTFFFPWEIRSSRIPDNTGYVAQLLAKNPYQMELGKIGVLDLLSRISQNFLLYSITIIPQTILPLLQSDILLVVFGLVFFSLSIVGFIKRINNYSLVEVYFIFAIVILLIWPRVWSSDRFLLPVLPLFIIYFFVILFWLQTKLKSKYFVTVIAGIMIFLNVLWFIPEAKRTLVNNLAYIKGDKFAGYTTDWRRYFEVIEWINRNIPREKVIMARKPEFVYLLSRHKSFCYPFTADIEKINNAISIADYIILDNFYWTGTTSRYLVPVIQKAASRYEIVHKTTPPEFYLLRVIK